MTNATAEERRAQRCDSVLRLLFAFDREFVEFCAPIVVRGAPSGLEQAAQFHAMEGRIERAFFHLEHLLRCLMDPLHDVVAVLGAAQESFEDKHLEACLESIRRYL